MREETGDTQSIDVPSCSPSVAVVLLNYRRRELCLSQVRAICSQSYPASISLVNNGTTDRVTISDLPDAEGRIVITDIDQNQGFAGGVNAGIAAARSKGADVYLVLNPDVKMESQVIERLVRSLEQVKGLSIIVPRNIGMVSKFGFRFGHQSMIVLHHGTRNIPIPLFAAFAWLIPERVLDVIGPFDDEFFFGREDTDMCFRLYLSGGRFVEVPNAIVNHSLEGGSPLDRATLRIRSYHMMRGRLLLMKKYPASRYGTGVALSQLAGIGRDIVAGFFTNHSLDSVAWQMRGLIPGSGWPISL